MQVVITPSKIGGTVTAPASKSAMQRACAAALVKGGKTILHNPGISADDKAALNIIEQLGATIEMADDKIIINSIGVHPVSKNIDCGESGLSVRMFTSIAALSNKEITINGSGSLLKRPLSFFNEVLPQLGVECESSKPPSNSLQRRESNGFLPLKIKGPLQLKNIEIDGSLSSQFLTGLLFTYSATFLQLIPKTSPQPSPKEREQEPVTIKVKNLNSKPYIDLTLQVMKDFGLPLPVNNNYEEFIFENKSIALPSKMISASGKSIDQLFNFSTDELFNYTIEADWSGAAFLLVAGAIAGKITVKGLNVFSTQADKEILQALMQTGVVMSIAEEQIEISKFTTGGGKPLHFNATHCPDLFPPLVALACYCNGTSVIEGVHRLTHKESNRALTLKSEFEKMGVEIILQDDLMLIKGTGIVKEAIVNSHHDHRIAMACAVAALNANGDVVIENAEAINKSYPQFWEHLQKLDAEVSLNKN